MEKQIELKDILLPDPKSIYLAGPFFNEPQIQTIEKVENLCDIYDVHCRSPRKFLVLKPKASWEDRKAVFQDNLLKIQQSAVMLACLDNPGADGTPRPPDTGTLWEMGYAYAIGRPVVGFTLGATKMNVMLAQGCAGFLQSIGDVGGFLEGKELGAQGLAAPWWDFAWEVAQAWRKDIY